MTSTGCSTAVMVETKLEDTVEKEEKPKLLILKLREPKKPSVTWTDDTVNNENMGKKSSKRCCIFHKIKKFAESDSDESNSDEEKEKDPDATPTPKTYQRHHA